ncbi:hypothetical protein BGI30_00915 [Snodgrassella alvi]|jgi:hypothetical protein|uniref:Uncharacterized protein n=1 Tax=Snodgrassella alvi TaxID=1196083 RepID=A0A855FNI3_9NEIS|nr:hypothetical protein BGI30_00915 [Snodgrassella alvi]PIT24848.1 hypothetical protein BGI35_00610 [Snodgrassella communis]PIT22527.1 hypothetical protein BGI37_13595 [Snodgrassella alvi]PIT47010.1 hypothetical protein BHC51_06820 [Snodgrassella alvi]PIT55869.1 hypothetical protein BHC59_10200 [Snodgrassella alvi]
MTATTPWMTAANALNRQPATPEYPVFLQRQYCILRTGRAITATWWQQRADGILVKPNQT